MPFLNPNLLSETKGIKRKRVEIEACLNHALERFGWGLQRGSWINLCKACGPDLSINRKGRGLI